MASREYLERGPSTGATSSNIFGSFFQIIVLYGYAYGQSLIMQIDSTRLIDVDVSFVVVTTPRGAPRASVCCAAPVRPSSSPHLYHRIALAHTIALAHAMCSLSLSFAFRSRPSSACPRLYPMCNASSSHLPSLIAHLRPSSSHGVIDPSWSHVVARHRMFRPRIMCAVFA